MKNVISAFGLVVVSVFGTACGAATPEPQVAEYVHPCDKNPNGTACQNYLFGMNTEGEEAADKREAARKEAREDFEVRSFDTTAGTRTAFHE